MMTKTMTRRKNCPSERRSNQNPFCLWKEMTMQKFVGGVGKKTYQANAVRK